MHSPNGDITQCSSSCLLCAKTRSTAEPYHPTEQDSAYICGCFLSKLTLTLPRRFLQHTFSAGRILLFASQLPYSLPVGESLYRTQPCDEGPYTMLHQIQTEGVSCSFYNEQYFEHQDPTHHPGEASPGWDTSDQLGQRTTIMCLQDINRRRHLDFMWSSCKLSVFTGHSFSGCIRNAGPDIHSVLIKKRSAHKAMETRSAVFCVVFTYLHWEALKVLRIYDTWFATKTWKLDVSLLIYFSTKVLSVQNTESRRGCLSSLFHSLSMGVATSAAVNFMQGIVTGFKGATLDFSITKGLCVCVQLLCSSSSTRESRITSHPMILGVCGKA